MTTSDGPLFVWVWLPQSDTPTIAGRLDFSPQTNTTDFTYGRTYLARSDAVSLYEPELPLRTGRIKPVAGLAIASCIRDAAPDAWGRRVILARKTGRLDRDSETNQLSNLTYLAESGSNRIGALDFQSSATSYVPRSDTSSIAELHLAASILDDGGSLTEPLADALVHGTSIGGARPKALIESEGRQYIAKFASSTDPYPVVRAEAAGLGLALAIGLDVPASRVIRSLGKDVLLIERFDRVARHRRMLVSGLTMLGLDEMLGRYATYPEIAEKLRASHTSVSGASMRELFSRVVFNIAIGNNDDHARNIAAFWDGRSLSLSPAYDLCPQLRSGEESAQAMAIGSDGARASQFQVCVQAAHDYHLDTRDAREIIDAQIATIRDSWTEVADQARLSLAERDNLWGRQILNPFASYGYRRIR